jgi:hypothetical protein
MAESFGNSFTIVEVTSDDPKPTRELWLALAKPSQAVTLVLAQVPEGWTAEIVPAVVTEKHLKLFQQVSWNPARFPGSARIRRAWFWPASSVA